MNRDEIKMIKRILLAGEIIRARIKGTSMMPIIKSNQFVEVKYKNPINVGDIAVSYSLHSTRSITT